MKELAMRLTPQAVITGRILDDNNEPVVSAIVRSMRYGYQMGRKQLFPAGNATTNDLGEYRIYGLTAGHYYLVAKEGNEQSEAMVDASAKPRLESYVATYYPGTIDPSAAAMIDVAPGAQLRGLNITLAKAHTVRLRGRVMGRRETTVSLVRRGQGPAVSLDSADRTVDEKGGFEFDGVLPGAYVLSASAWIEQKMETASQDVNVGENNIDNLVLVLTAGTEVHGHIAPEGDHAPDLRSVSVLLIPNERTIAMYNSFASQVQDGGFTFSGVAAGIYHLSVMGLPDGYWIRSVRMGEQEVKLTGVDLTHPSGDPITVTLAPNAGQIDGVVSNPQQQPAAGARVVLVPETKLRENEELYQTSVADQNGHFSLKNIEPGDYKVFAWEDMEYGAYMDPDFLRPVEDRGQSISIKEGSREIVQLDVIAADSTSALSKESR